VAGAERLRILLLSGWVDQAFTFVRSFSRQRDLDLLVADCWPNSPCGYSRHCTRFHLIPKPEDPDHIPAILTICKKENIDIVLPVQHDEVIEVSRKKELFESEGVRVPLPRFPLIELANDKYRLTRMLGEHGIAVPRTYLLAEADPADLEREIGFPMLIKLRNSTGQRGQTMIRNMAELEAQTCLSQKEYPAGQIIVQEYIPGSDFDTMYTVGLIYNHNHRLRACVPLKKIRSRPYTGGTAICTKAVNRDDIAETAIRVMSVLGQWEGIADVEIKMDPRDAKPKFIELNPRPWGSMYGAYVAGVDFPMLWVKLALGETLDPIEHFHENIYASFLTRDLLLLADLVGRLFSEERRDALRVLRTYSRPYFRRDGNSSYNVTSDFSLSDPHPFFKNLARVKKDLLPGTWWK
jgi:predicted ATP-grasp superfamily ATP-dependent carboligase